MNLSLKYSIYALLLTLCAHVHNAAAITQDYPKEINFRDIMQNQDIALGEVQAIIQDHEGFMWLGGRNALLRYDGYEFLNIFIANNTQASGKMLAVSQVRGLLEDSRHDMWVATNIGLFKYDRTREVLVPISLASATKSLARSMVFSLNEAPNGDIIAGTDSGIIIFNQKTLKTQLITHIDGDNNSLPSNNILDTFIDKKGAIWIGINEGLARLDLTTKKLTLIIPNPNNPKSSEDNGVKTIAQDHNGDLWLGTDNGIYRFNPTNGAIKRYFNNPDAPNSLAQNMTRKIFVDKAGWVWTGSDSGGISLYDSSKDQFNRFQHQEGHAGSISNNGIRCFYEDNAGDLWVGNYPSGINYYDRSTAAVTVLRKAQDIHRGLLSNNVEGLAEDKAGNLWIGAAGVTRYDPHTQTFSHYQPSTSGDSRISSDSILNGYIDSTGELRFGTWAHGIELYNPKTDRFDEVPTDPNLVRRGITTSETLNDRMVWSVYEDKRNTLWIGTHFNGLTKYNKQNRQYTYYPPNLNDPTAISFAVVWTTLEDAHDRFWVGTAKGLNLMDRDKGTFKRYFADANNPHSLANDSILSIYEDHKGRLWFGTDAGLHVYRPETDDFTHYGTEEGFVNNGIRAITEDKLGNLWLGTNNGIVMFNADTHLVRNFMRYNGETIGRVATGAALALRNGSIVFGAQTGAYIFNPNKLVTNKIIPAVVLTDFRIFTQKVPVNGPDKILSQVINQTQQITLDHTSSMISFNFAALNYRDSEKNQYAYKLEGFDDKWRLVGAQRTALYTNLDAGHYIFKAKASNNDGVWNEQGATVNITILPALWRSPIAYALYALTTMAMIAGLARTQRKKLKDAQTKIAQERALVEKMKNLDALKENFLANTSHELRTPLNGIIGLAESLCSSDTDSALEIQKTAKMILHSGKRLANIVNDILDFSQLASNELVLTLTHIKLRPSAEAVLTGLQDRINDKSLRIFNNIPEQIEIYSDESRLKQIFYRLLDNAIKFTREGAITLDYTQNEQFDLISITDTGIGIDADNIGSIFTAFQQVEGSAKRTAEGAGLGLSVVQKLVALHKGELRVESVVGQGSKFCLSFPRSIATSVQLDEKNHSVAPATSDTQTSNDSKSFAPAERKHKVQTIYFNGHLYADELSLPTFTAPCERFKILVVDDDPTNRMVVKSHLQKHHFKTVEAIDGEDALKMLAEHTDIDLIVLDVMMPYMTGYEMCETLRRQTGLHGIPVIFLTANHQPNEIVNAFVAGGSDFITKPVSAKLLTEKVKNLLSLFEETRRIDRFFYPNKAVSAHSDPHAFAKENMPFTKETIQNFDLPQAIANIVEQAFCLISTADMIGCWLINEQNFFDPIDNVPALPSAAEHLPLSLHEMKGFMDNAGTEHTISLARNIADAAKSGRLGNSVARAENLQCELITLNEFVFGFIILGGPTAPLATPEHKSIMQQCQKHIAAAVTKMKKIEAITG